MRVKGTCIRVTSLATLTISSLCSLSTSLVVAILLFKISNDYDDLSSGDDYAIMVALLFVASSVVSLIDLLIGCCGLHFANNCLLKLYLCIGVVLVTLQVGSSSFYFAASQDKHHLLGSHIYDELRTAVINYQPENEYGIIDVLQFDEECCGVENYTDWRHYDTEWKKNAQANQHAPESCCQLQYSNEEDCNTNLAEINQKGCFPKLLDRHQLLAKIALAVCLVSAVLEVLARLLICKTLYILWDFKRQGYNVI